MKIPPNFKEYVKNAYKKTDEALHNVKTEYENLTSKSKLEKLEDFKNSSVKKYNTALTKLRNSESNGSSQLEILQAQRDLFLANNASRTAVENYKLFSQKQAAAQEAFNRLNNL